MLVILVSLFCCISLAAGSCCTRTDSCAQASPGVVELRCDDRCLGWTGDFWIGGREGLAWSAGGRTVLHVVDYQGEQLSQLYSSMYVQGVRFGEDNEVGLILSYENMENYVALLTNIMDRNMWTVVEVKGNKRIILLSDNFEKTTNLRELFYFTFTQEAGKLRCTIKSDDLEINLSCPEDCLRSQLPSPFCSARGDLRWDVMGCYFPLLQ